MSTDTEEMLVEIVGADMIKPSSPTPDHLRLHKLSLVDQLFPPIYTTLLLYYVFPAQETSLLLDPLKKSLSEILLHYYPFAGRIVDNACVECTDVGVPFMEAKVIDLKTVLERRDPDMLKQYLPVNGSSEEAGNVPLQIQATFSECGGGIVLGICASHKIMDGAALFAFIHSWAQAAASLLLGGGRGHDETSNIKRPLPPQLALLSSLVPSSDLLLNNSITTGQQEMKPDVNNCVITKIFVFTAATIAALLRDIDRSAATRVQAVSTLIWKCAIKATKLRSSTKKSSSIMLVAVNMRKRFNPALPENTPGNFIGNFNLVKDYEEDIKDNIDLGELLDKMKDGLKGFCDNFIKKLQLCKEGMPSVILESAMESRDIVMRQDIDLFHNTSWCGFKLYEVDFGWGKPAWVSSARNHYENVFVLIDAKKKDGIEAWVTLTKQDMAVFEQDPELLSFASVFPNQ